MAKKDVPSSIRKTKKAIKRYLKTSGVDDKAKWEREARALWIKKKKYKNGTRKPNPHYIVHDDAGKSIVKTKSKKAATYIARAASGHVTKGTKLVYSARRSNPKGKKNPKAMLFANRAAALTYAASHGLKNFSISKVRKAK
jgi:hypothetical protein